MFHGMSMGTSGMPTTLESGDPMIRLCHVHKRYPDGTVAVARLSLDVAAGELVCLVGPSGCGKTTTMKMINRLIEPTSGQIMVEGRDVAKVDPVRLRRRIGYVIQHVGLFPHLTIRDNVAAVPRLLGWPRRRQLLRADELLDLVGLDPPTYAGRYPRQLSGGQQQRVGVARALAADPPVLLMDEPFSAVDPLARDRLQQEFLRLQREIRKTVVFVTHDLGEAIRLADRIAVLRQGGHLEQYDCPARVLGAPATPFVADFVGADRGLRRLSVTGIRKAELEHPPRVTSDDLAEDARQVIEAAGKPGWAVVLDGDGRVRGWVTLALLSQARAVRDVIQPLPPSVELDGTLEDALSSILAHQAGRVAVLDDGRYVGVLTPESVHAALHGSRW